MGNWGLGEPWPILIMPERLKGRQQSGDIYVYERTILKLML
jgi:hypothetical protein